jgi:hypothetical protein
MRPAYDGPVGGGQRSATPIYDALYAEYRRSFRALPGDRSGEEDLGFKGFSGRADGSGDAGFAMREHSGTWDTSGRQYRRDLPAALPPAQRDSRRQGL